MSWTDKVRAHLVSTGYRMTSPRRMILERIIQYAQPFSTEQLFRDLGGDEGPVGRATVYRTVELLLEDGWIARVHWSATGTSILAGEHAYVPVEPGHKHHMICQNCGTVITFEGCHLDEILGGLAQRLNFRVDGHWLEIYGLCQQCQRKL